MEDITKTGPVGLKGLKGINKQTESNERWNTLLAGIKKSTGRQMSEAYTPEQSVDVGMRAFEAGYGNSTYDRAIQSSSQFENIQDIRALEQPWYAKIGAGAAKMGVLAATTFADSILGTVSGIFNVAAEASKGNIHDAANFWWKFIDNPISEGLQSINEASEQWLPNYYTEYERQAPWYENIFTANFLGDKFLKNLGFTIGAAAGAYVTGMGAAKAFAKKGIREAFKGAVVNSAGKTLNTGKDIYKAYKVGDAFMDGAKLTNDLAKAAKQLKHTEQGIKILGAVSSAMGEGRIEAISGVNEWSKAQEDYARGAHEDFKANLQQNMYEENPDYFEYTTDAEGNTYMKLSELGQREYNRRITEEQATFENLMATINKDKAAIGNSIFGLNVALLTISDLYQWGRFISGGYTSGRNFKGLVTGNLKDGYRVAKDAIRNKRLKALSNPLIEAQEEMSQSSIQEGSGMWKSRELNSKFGEFYGGKIDPDAESETASWLDNIMNGFVTQYGDINKWEEGFIGGLTGMLGIPTIKTKSNGKKGLALQGELWEGLKDANAMKEEANAIVDALNKNIKSPEFLNYYQGKIRHDAAQNEMDTALDRGDRFEFLNSEHKQQVSDAIMYDKAGRIEDLYDLIDQAANTTLEDVDTLRKQAVDKNTGESIFKDKTDQQVVDHVKKQAQTMKDTVDKYVQISSDLKTLYGDSISSDVLEELTWGMTQVDNWENRIKSLTGDVRNTLQDKAKELKNRFDVDIDIILDKLTDFGSIVTEDKDLISEINNVINDKNLPVQEQRNKIDNLIKEKNIKRSDNNLELGKKILQIRKDFKKSRERLDNQRKRLLKQIDEAEEDKKEFLQNSDEYKQQFEENKNAQVQLVKDTRDKIEKIENEIFSTKYKNQKTSKRLNKKELDNMVANNDVNVARLNDIMTLLDTRILAIEGMYMSDTVLDKRTKLGYIAGGQKVLVPKIDKNGNIIKDEKSNILYEERSSLEEEVRQQYKSENESLLSQIVALKEVLNSENNKLVNPLDTEKLLESLSDLSKIMVARSSFLDTYQGLSEHPELYQTALQERLQEAVRIRKNKEIDRVQTAIEDVDNISNLRKILDDENDSEIVQEAIDKIKSGDNTELKDIVSNYEGIEDAKKVIFGENYNGSDSAILDGIVGSMTASTEVSDAATEIFQILDSSETVKEANKGIADRIEELKQNPSTELIADTMKSIMDKYAKLSKSRRTRKSDKKSSRTLKKSTIEELDDDEDEDDEDENDEKDKTEKPRRRYPNRRMPSFDDDEGMDSLDDEIDLGLEEDEDEVDDDNDEEDEDIDKEKTEDIELLQNLSEMSIEELEEFIDNIDVEIAKGIVINGETIDESEKSIVLELANKILDRKKNPRIHGSKSDKGTNSESKFPSNNSPYYRSWIQTGYDINEAKVNHKAVLSENPKANALRELGVFDFIDKGKLGILLEGNEDLLIHFITVGSGPLAGEVILTIEVTDDVRNVGIEGSTIHYNGKSYQAIGALGYSGGSRVATNWKALKKELYSERKQLMKSNPPTGSSTPSMVVSEKFTNRVSHIYSGRMVTSTSTEDKKQRGLKEVLAGERPIFGVYFSESRFDTDDSIPYVPINTNNSNPREGSLWLMTREADGRYYGKSLKVKRFTPEEYSIQDNIDTPIMQDIMEALSIIVDPSMSDSERALARLQLEDCLYFPGDSRILFSGDVISIKDENGNIVENNIGEGLEGDDKIQAILDILYKGDLNLRFQVNSYKAAKHPIDNEDYIQYLLDSNIITTDLAVGYIHNINASFDMPLLDPKTGAEISNPGEAEERVGHTGKLGVNNTITRDTVYVNSVEYRVDNDGNIEDSNGNKLALDSRTKSEIKLALKIKQGKVQPVEGNPNLYLDVYEDLENFGIINGKVKTGDELDTLLEKAKRNARKKLESAHRKSGKPTLDSLEKDPDDESEVFDWMEGDTPEASLFGDVGEYIPSGDEDDILGLDDDYNEDDAEPSERPDWDTDEEIPEASIFGNDDTGDTDTPKETPKKSGKPNKSKELIGESFNPDSIGPAKDISVNPNSLLIANRTSLTNMGLSISINLWKDIAEQAGIDFNTLTSQDKFEAAIETVNCFKFLPY